MGMYSAFTCENIEIKDLEGLKLFMEEWKKTDLYEKEIDKNMLLKKDGTDEYYFTFESWNNIKLISYFYDNTLIFLHCVADYIEGEVHWDFENDDEAGWVEFKDKKCIIHTGQTCWSNWEPSGAIRDKNKIPNNIRKLMIVGKL